MVDILYKQEAYRIIGRCIEVYNHLGPGFLEIVYKDALEYEFKKNFIPFIREKRYEVHYKDIVLNHVFHADFVVYDKIILEAKTVSGFNENHIAQCINYLRVSRNKLALLVNFGGKKLQFKRVILEEKMPKIF